MEQWMSIDSPSACAMLAFYPYVSSFQVWDWWHIAQHVWLLWRWLFLRDSQPADKIRRGLGTRARRRPLWRLLPLDTVLSVRSFRYTLLPHYASYPRDPDQMPSIQNISPELSFSFHDATISALPQIVCFSIGFKHSFGTTFQKYIYIVVFYPCIL